MSQIKIGDYLYYKADEIKQKGKVITVHEIKQIGKVTEVDSKGCVIDWGFSSSSYTSGKVEYTFRFLEMWIKQGNVKPFFPLVEIIE